MGRVALVCSAIQLCALHCFCSVVEVCGEAILRIVLSCNLENHNAVSDCWTKAGIAVALAGNFDPFAQLDTVYIRKEVVLKKKLLGCCRKIC